MGPSSSPLQRRLSEAIASFITVSASSAANAFSALCASAFSSARFANSIAVHVPFSSARTCLERVSRFSRIVVLRFVDMCWFLRRRSRMGRQAAPNTRERRFDALFLIFGQLFRLAHLRPPTALAEGPCQRAGRHDPFPCVFRPFPSHRRVRLLTGRSRGSVRPRVWRCPDPC